MSPDPSVGDPLVETQPLVPTEVMKENARRELVSQVMGDVAAPTIHNFQGTNLEVWKQIAAIGAATCMDFDDVQDSGIQIHQFYVHQVQFVDEKTGEVNEGIRTVLIPKVGPPFACVSDGIARDLAGIIRTFGFGPYEPPISVMPVSIKTRKGRKTYRLVPQE